MHPSWQIIGRYAMAPHHALERPPRMLMPRSPLTVHTGNLYLSCDPTYSPSILFETVEKFERKLINSIFPHLCREDVNCMRETFFTYESRGELQLYRN